MIIYDVIFNSKDTPQKLMVMERNNIKRVVDIKSMTLFPSPFVSIKEIEEYLKYYGKILNKKEIDIPAL